MAAFMYQELRIMQGGALSEDKRKLGIPEPHSGQDKVLALPKRVRVAVCGRRFGKTVAAAIAAIRRCREREAQRVWWISPVQEQSDRVERQVVAWLVEEEGEKPKAEGSKQI